MIEERYDYIVIWDKDVITPIQKEKYVSNKPHGL